MENETNYVWNTLQPTHTRKNRQILNNRIFKLVWFYFFRFFFYQYRLRVKSDVVDQNVFMAFYWIYLTKAAEKNGLLIINCKNSIFQWKLKQPEKNDAICSHKLLNLCEYKTKTATDFFFITSSLLFGLRRNANEVKINIFCVGNAENTSQSWALETNVKSRDRTFKLWISTTTIAAAATATAIEVDLESESESGVRANQHKYNNPTKFLWFLHDGINVWEIVVALWNNWMKETRKTEFVW